MAKRPKKSTGQVGVSQQGSGIFNPNKPKPKGKKRAPRPKLATANEAPTPQGGRPPYVPTETDIAIAKALAEVGYSQDDMAAHFGIDRNTVVKHFGTFIREGKGIAIAKGYGAMARALAPSAPLQHALQAGKFILATKGKDHGWSSRQEIAGPDGADIFAGLDLTKLSEQKLNLLQDLLTLAGATI